MRAILAALLLSGCVATGPSPVVQALVSEYDAYFAYVQSEYNAGRISKEHGNYLLEQKKNELYGRAQAMTPPPTPIYRPIPPLQTRPPVNCTTTTAYGVAQTHCY